MGPFLSETCTVPTTFVHPGQPRLAARDAVMAAAAIGESSPTPGLSGQAAPAANAGAVGYVYRRYRGRTLRQRRPVFTKPWSERQTQTRNTFAGGSRFAAQVKADDELRRLYAAQGRRRRLNYRQMAIRDYFQPPTLLGLVTEKDPATRAPRLVIRAKDDFEVVRVGVILRDADGHVVSAGDALPCDGKWRYALPASPPANPCACTAEVTACDRPGNTDTRVFPLT